MAIEKPLDMDEAASLFADLLHEPELPDVPLALMPYFEGASDAELRNAAEVMFIIWLRRRLALPFTPLRELESFVPPCSDLAVASAFIPNWPEAEDFGYEDDDPAFFDDPDVQAARYRADLASAVARRVCWEECPVRELCLAQSMMIDHDEYEADSIYQDFDYWTVLGGYRPLGRISIRHRFVRLRRAYEAGERCERRRVRVAEWKGMTRSELRAWRQRADEN